MSILPWDNWFYHIDDKKKKVRSLYSEAHNLNKQIKTEIDHYNSMIKPYKSLTAQNAALLIISQIINYTDDQYKNYLQAVAAMPDPVKGSVPIEVAQLVTEVTGLGLVAKGIFNLGKLAKNGLLNAGEGGEEAVSQATIEGVTEGVAEAGLETAGEAAAEGVAEVATEGVLEAALADTGVGIILAVGIDAILGFFEGKKEAHKLDEQISKIEGTLQKLYANRDKVRQQQARLTKGIVQQEQTFMSLLKDLSKIAPPPFSHPAQIDPNHISVFLGAQSHALRFYGPLVDLRNTYLKAMQRHQTVTKEGVIEHVLYISKQDVTEAILEQYWAVLAKNSALMRNAAGGGQTAVTWKKVPNVAQYGGADWSNLVERHANLTVEQAQAIGAANPKITFFFIMRSNMYLGAANNQPAKGSFSPGDAVFFSGQPWYGSAPQADAYEKQTG
ncbi:MAG: hypothetical protein AAF614_04730 [Chloroflexota bacterium]